MSTSPLSDSSGAHQMTTPLSCQNAALFLALVFAGCMPPSVADPTLNRLSASKCQHCCDGSRCLRTVARFELPPDVCCKDNVPMECETTGECMPLTVKVVRDKDPDSDDDSGDAVEIPIEDLDGDIDGKEDDDVNEEDEDINEDDDDGIEQTADDYDYLYYKTDHETSTQAPTKTYPPGSEKQVCQGIQDLLLGQRIRYANEWGVVACSAEISDQLVGICQDADTGTDNFDACDWRQKTRPSFCEERSLKFVRCEQVISQLEGSHTPKVPPIQQPACGCSWSPKNGCIVSDEQLLLELSHEQMVEPECSDTDIVSASRVRGNGSLEIDGNIECALRRAIAKETQRFKDCLSLNPIDCLEKLECQWSSQKENQCGIDEEQLVLNVVGPQNANHPLVKMVRLHDHCSKHSEQSCAADPSCAWSRGYPQSHCDTSPSLMYRMLLTDPVMVMEMQAIRGEASCRAQHNSYGMCERPCSMKTGVCALEAKSFGAKTQLNDILNAVCLQLYRVNHTCPSMCRVNPGGICEPSRQMRWDHLAAPQANSRAAKMLILLLSATQKRYDICGSYDSRTCMASHPTCSASDAKEQGSTSIADHAADHDFRGPGLKGVLQEAAQAIADGKAGDFVNDYLEKNPDSVKVLATSLVGKLADIIKQTTTQEAHPQAFVAPITGLSTTATPEVSTALSEIVPGTVPPAASPLGTLPPAEWLPISNAWAIAGGSILVAALCAGVALGAVCHARTIRVKRARELSPPLLTSTDVLQDQELVLATLAA